MQRFDWGAFRYLFRTSFWAHLWKEINKDHCWGMAAELAYYFLLGFFPFLIFLSNIITVSQVEPGLLGKILNELGRFLPEMTQEEVVEIVGRSRAETGTLWVFVWMAVALWWASLGLNGMVGIMNKAYRVQENRSPLRVMAQAVVVTLGVSLFIILSGILLFFGDDLIRVTIYRLPFEQGSPVFGWLRFLYTVLRWFLIFVFFNLGIQIVYFSLPAKRLPWRLLSPGSVVASLGWLFGSLIFSSFVNQNPAYDRLYGSLKSMIVLMIWFYISSLFLIIGGTMDSEIFRMRRSTGHADLDPA
jgi:membrane protein